nr:ATP-dependent helicase HrpB [Acanthopleuribacter pedis]
MPVETVLPQVAEALRRHRAVVLEAPTGSGKTTRVPPFLYRSGLLGDGQLVMLQPRRVAARACARAIADQLDSHLGDLVGYQVRFERRVSAKTRVAVVTEGILTRRFISDSLLEGVSCVVLDEFHERSIHTDTLLAFLHELRQLRDDLTIVVMSATLRGEAIAAYLGDCPIVRAEGRLFPLETSYLPLPKRHAFGEGVADALRQLFSVNDDGGHVLVFLPGVPEIERVRRFLAEGAWPAEVTCLHGSLSSEEQDRVLAPGGPRRIILATNVAETSLTIYGVSAVIDAGYHKQMTYDVFRGLNRLEMKRISLASAVQRAGRAGRQRAGRVIRLWDPTQQALLEAEERAEIHRVDLCDHLLPIIDFHGPNLADFPFFEPPAAASLDESLKVLHMLGALDPAGRLTEKGRTMTAFPLHPRLASMAAFAAEHGGLEHALALCAVLPELPREDHRGLPEHVEDFRVWLADPRGRPPFPGARTAQRGLRQLERLAKKTWPRAKARANLRDEDLALWLLQGYPDRLFRVTAPGAAVGGGGRGVTLPNDHLKVGQLFLALELRDGKGGARAGRIVPVAATWLDAYLEVETRLVAVYDPRRQAVVGKRQRWVGDFLVGEKEGVKVDDVAVAEALADAAGADWERVFQPDDRAKRLLCRLQLAHQHLADDTDWPAVDPPGLQALLRDHCFGKRSLADLRKLNWYDLLLQQVPWSARELLDRELPEKLTVPSGSRITVDYEAALGPAGRPILAARIQEMFGLQQTPRLARGRLPVLCHLLAPSRRPVQVTEDLANFWRSGYAEVRKELRARYAKHYWPENPLEAEAIRGVRPRKK